MCQNHIQHLSVPVLSYRIYAIRYDHVQIDAGYGFDTYLFFTPTEASCWYWLVRVLKLCFTIDQS